MKILYGRCRELLSAADRQFVVSVLARDAWSREHLEELLDDPEMLELLLDSVELHQHLLEFPLDTRVSSRLRFYLLVRWELRRNGIDDRAVADYVAEMLTQFSDAAERLNGEGRHLYSISTLVNVLGRMHASREEKGLLLQQYAGNFCLFVTGLHPGIVVEEARSTRARGFEYYERLGSASFLLASRLRLAGEFELTGVFQTLSQRFHQVRACLNKLATTCTDVLYPPRQVQQLHA